MINSKASLPPTINGAPIIGAIPQLLSHGLNFWTKNQQEYGDIYTLNLGLTKVIVCNHPDHADHILRKNRANYTKKGRFWDTSRGIFGGDGLVTSDGDLWRHQRRLIQPLFNHNQLIPITDLMIDAIDEGLEEIEALIPNNAPINMNHELSNLTAKVIVKTMCGDTFLSRGEIDQTAEAWQHILDRILPYMVTSKLPKWLPISSRQRYEAERTVTQQTSLKVINNYRQSGQQSNSIVSMLLGAVDAETGQQMSDEQLLAETSTMFVAGYETTANGLSWAIHYLSQNRDVLAKLQAEVDTVLGQRRPTFADIPQLKYAQMVFYEALRSSSSLMLPRYAENDDVIDGYHIPANSEVVILLYAIHHHPQLWENPDLFDPNRFESNQMAERHKLAWMPFGAGQRLCIGKSFAEMEAKLILARLLQRYEISAIPNRVATPQHALVVRPRNGVWVSLTPR